MGKIIVAYWSQTGNTQTMAEYIEKGIIEAGKNAEVLEISNVSLDTLKQENVFALGCPAMGDEVLEESEMEPFVDEVEKFVDGKKVALFGSFGWGDGQWMQEWEERMKKAGATIVGGNGVVARDTPDAEAELECKKLGKLLAEI